MQEQRSYAIEGTTAIQLTPTPRLRLVYDAERDERPTCVQPAPEVNHAQENVPTTKTQTSTRCVPRDTSQLLISSLALVLALMVASWGVDVIRDSRRTTVLDAVPLCEIAVGTGDSLWSIAETHPVEGVSTSELVAWIKEANGIESSALALGQTLTVPRNDIRPMPSA